VTDQPPRSVRSKSKMFFFPFIIFEHKLTHRSFTRLCSSGPLSIHIQTSYSNGLNSNYQTDNRTYPRRRHLLLLGSSNSNINVNATTKVNTNSVRMCGVSTGAVKALLGGRARPGSGSVSKSATSGLLAHPTVSINGGFLAPPVNHSQSQGQGGSIALRAMRSVRSLARMESWAQFSSEDNAKETATKDKKKDATVGKKDSKAKTKKMP